VQLNCNCWVCCQEYNAKDSSIYVRISVSGSRNSVSGDSSVIEGSGNFEDMLKSPGKRPHFQHRRRNLIPKAVGTELFMVSPVLNIQYDLPLQEERELSEAVYSDSGTV
jgi:hypothetical protein